MSAILGTGSENGSHAARVTPKDAEPQGLSEDAGSSDEYTPSSPTLAIFTICYLALPTAGHVTSYSKNSDSPMTHLQSDRDDKTFLCNIRKM
jgi:hypothetical protein